MSYRKCYVCAGSGSLWGTPPLIENGGLSDSKKTYRLEDTPDRSYGISVTCWRCLGIGSVADDKQDEGQHNG